MTTPICRNWAFVPSTKASDANRHRYTIFIQAPILQAFEMASAKIKEMHPDAEAVIFPALCDLDDRPNT